jgi:glycosyltransferase involved in cell wall biosynthesis
MSDSITISVVIPAWNAAKTISETLDSIAHQTRLPNEVIVVDDGSSDTTQAVLERHHLNPLVIAQAQSGAATAMNRGWQAASSDWIAFLDSDDLWTPNWLASVEQSLMKRRVDLILGQLDTFLDPSFTSVEAQQLRYQTHADKAYLIGCSVFRKEALMTLGGFDPSFKTGYFIELFDRFQRSELTYHHVAKEGLLRRIRKNSLSWTATQTSVSAASPSPLAQDFLRIARQSILAKKNAGKTQDS